jgi:hypothetical protein
VHPGDPLLFVGTVLRARTFLAIELAPALLGVVQHQGLAQACRADGLAVADARADVDPATAGQLVQIVGAVVFHDAQVDGVFQLFPQPFQVRAGQARQVHLLAGQITQLQQLGAQAVAFARGLGQQAALDQGGGQAVSRAAGQAQALGQGGQADGAGVGDHVEQVQAPEQRLAAAGRLGSGGVILGCH